MAESYEKQKRFITDAGHELKTPLTVINANTDILEMEIGEKNESLEDIRQQIRRLTKLTNDLVLLARMEEAEGKLQKLPLPLSELTAEAVHPFRALAQAQHKHLTCHIAPMVTVSGCAKDVTQLVTILMDNALKYTPEGGSVTVDLEVTGKNARLSLVNTTGETLSQGDLEHLFDRFYRPDASRNSATGGHGIGLSVAKAIVHNHGGKIRATAEPGTFCICATFPLS
jgi:signal transduction histidine kinase